jgi:hypothetical protein
MGLRIPESGLTSSMLNRMFKLDPDRHIHHAAANSLVDPISTQCHISFIVQCIKSAHPKAFGSLEPDEVKQLEFPAIDRLDRDKTIHYGLGPLMENEGTIEGTYQVINQIFKTQFELHTDDHYKDIIQLVYGDQKTCGLVGSIKHESQQSRDIYGSYRWILPIPGPFHWRTNFIKMIMEIFYDETNIDSECTLSHNAILMGIKQGHTDPFHYQEQLAMQSVNARVLARLYTVIKADGRSLDIRNRAQVNTCIENLSFPTMLRYISIVRETIFSPCELSNKANDMKKKGQKKTSVKKDKIKERAAVIETLLGESSATKTEDSKDTIDYIFDGHKRFIQYMETYYTFREAIRYGDIGHIRRLYPRFALLFFGGNKIKYGILSLYMTWLTGTGAASPELQEAILANSLVNTRGANDSWYEIDRLNEFLNLEMKRIMVSRRTSTQSLEDLFRRTALTASYCIELQSEIDYLSNRLVSSKHTSKQATLDIYGLAIRLYELQSLQQMEGGRDAEFIPKDLLAIAAGVLIRKKVDIFNQKQVADPALDEPTHTPIAILDEFTTDPDIVDS